MIEIKTKEEFENALKSSPVVGIKIGTSSCGPCKATAENLKKWESKLPENTKLFEIDAEEADEDIIDNLRIRNVPTVIVFNDGNESKRHVGFMSEDKIKEFFFC